MSHLHNNKIILDRANLDKTVPKALQDFFAKHNKIALAFSGGVDSAYLLYAACACNASVMPYYVKAQFQPLFERQDAEELCNQLNIPMQQIKINVLENQDVVANRANRCFYCKREIFTQILSQAAKDGYTEILDGTNASDDAGDRPGMVVLEELHVLSPLRMVGLTKNQIREYSRMAGLFTWNKPAYACLATRIPTGRKITDLDLIKVEQSEDFLFAKGFSDFRVRLTDRGCKIQLPMEQAVRFVQLQSEIFPYLSKNFKEVVLDMEFRKSI